MGKGKKKFIDKKKSATFQLLARDSSDPNYDNTPGNDRVFVRVDNNPHSFLAPFFSATEDYPSDSIFADAPEDNEGVECVGAFVNSQNSLPEDVRREILELGFPDDGYNYLLHLREIKNTGGGSAFYHNPKASFVPLPHDVKAYDASRVAVGEVKSIDTSDKSIYSIAARTVVVRVQKAVDPEVAALLDDSDLSRFGSDVEDLEEDFVVRANLPDGGKKEDVVVVVEDADQLEVVNDRVDGLVGFGGHGNEVSHGDAVRMGMSKVEGWDAVVDKKPRVPRLLDEQFDLLEHQEYDTDAEDEEYGGYVAEEDEVLADKLKNALNDLDMDDLEIEDNYKAPADILHGNQGPKNREVLDSAADVMRRCAEYAMKYENEDEKEDVVLVQESSSESEEWDCETIVSTYSNLDNHPARIEAPGTARKKKIAEAVSGAISSNSHVIALRGKEKLPVDFLPHGRKSTAEKLKSVPGSQTEQQKRKQHGQESKEEKKERKAAVKEERRHARRVKKEMKGLYCCEAQRAQKVAAITGPSSIHLM